MPTAVRSHAKINLGLGVGAPRSDGFHALATVYQTLELFDVLTITAKAAVATAIRLTSNDARVPTNERNTAWKMVEQALKALGITAEVDIHIEKRLPVQGGLGAGSANAVAALVGLEVELGIVGNPGLKSETEGTRSKTESKTSGIPPIEQKTLEGWGTGADSGSARAVSSGAPAACGYTRPVFGGRKAGKRLRAGGASWVVKRLEIAARVGSDVPLFLIGGTVLGLDRGQEVYPLPDIEPVWCVVATPEVGVSTAQAFRDWDALCVTDGLTREASNAKLNELSRAYASAFAGGIPQGGLGTGSSGVLLEERNLAGPQESALVRTGISSWIQNDFERVVFPQQPSLAEIKRLLAASGTPEASLHASLSGSGSALFGLYLTRGDAEAACERLRPAGVRSQLTRTLPRTAYWREMLLH